MAEEFFLTVSYKGQELEFPVILKSRGYTYGIEISIEGWEVVLEPDEEGQLRVIAMNADEVKKKEPEPGLIQAVAAAIQALRE